MEVDDEVEVEIGVDRLDGVGSSDPLAAATCISDCSRTSLFSPSLVMTQKLACSNRSPSFFEEYTPEMASFNIL